MRKIISVIIALCIIFVMPLGCAAQGDDTQLSVTASGGTTLDIKAKSAILLEPFTNTILYESNADEQLPPASITKIMSLLLVMEAIDNGQLTLDTKITASDHACSMGGSQIWLEPGEVMTVDELLKAAVIASANDATVALGEAVAGSEEGFVQMMNDRAKELGMNNTTFINSTGLDAQGHLTTAHDVAIMSAELIKHPLIKNYSTVWMDTLRNGESELVNTNKLVRFYEGTTGLKTGTTSGAGYCLSATAKRDNMELVAVIMGGDTSNDRFSGAQKLLNFGFANYTFATVLADIPENTRVEVAGGVQKDIGVTAKGGLDLLLKRSDTGKITQSIELKSDVTASINKGDVVGYVRVCVDQNEVGIIELVSDTDVKKLDFLAAFGWILSALFTL